MKMELTKYEKINYVMKDNEDKEVVRLIKLKDDWRNILISSINCLNKLLTRH